MSELQDINQKIIPFKKFHNWVKGYKKNKTILAGGCFDIFHFGHLAFLQGAKKLGGKLVIALESDHFIKRNKNKIPIHNQLQRAQILSSLTYVDAIILLPLFSSDRDYFKLVADLRPKFIAITQNDSNIAKKREQAKTVGAEVKTVTDFIKGFTSSKIAAYATIRSD